MCWAAAAFFHRNRRERSCNKYTMSQWFIPPFKFWCLTETSFSLGHTSLVYTYRTKAWNKSLKHTNQTKALILTHPNQRKVLICSLLSFHDGVIFVYPFYTSPTKGTTPRTPEKTTLRSKLIVQHAFKATNELGQRQLGQGDFYCSLIILSHRTWELRWKPSILSLWCRYTDILLGKRSGSAFDDDRTILQILSSKSFSLDSGGVLLTWKKDPATCPKRLKVSVWKSEKDILSLNVIGNCEGCCFLTLHCFHQTCSTKRMVVKSQHPEQHEIYYTALKWQQISAPLRGKSWFWAPRSGWKWIIPGSKFLRIFFQENGGKLLRSSLGYQVICCFSTPGRKVESSWKFPNFHTSKISPTGPPRRYPGPFTNSFWSNFCLCGVWESLGLKRLYTLPQKWVYLQ